MSASPPLDGDPQQLRAAAGSAPAATVPGFDLAGELPRGVWVLEASAGTGKTYAIAGLAARYVAEGVPLPEILLVTFTRMATGELRERVRDRLASVERGLRQALAGTPPDGRDAVVTLLAQGAEAEVARRRERLQIALSDFDAGTIATIHGFCEEVLRGLGIAGDLEPGVELVEDPSDLVAEVLDDLYLRRFHNDRPAFSHAEAIKIARAAVENPTTELVPGRGREAHMRVRMAGVVREEVEARKRAGGVLGYDDLLTRLQGALQGDDGAEVAERLRSRYRIVLVDEFQDTDPVQWEIMRAAFGSGAGTLVLIADPKQAIYAFRGADVYAYLDAEQAAATHSTLGVNWRSDQPLLHAFDALFNDTKLGHPRIPYRRVRAAPGAEERRLRGAPHPAPLRIRIAQRSQTGTTPGGFAQTGPARELICEDLAADLVALLSSPATIPEADTGRQRRIRPGDVAVLVPRNSHAAQVREALERVGLPAVTAGAGSVFATPGATDWLRLLEAIEQPTSRTRAHAAALTAFLGWSAAELAEAKADPAHPRLSAIYARLHEWGRILRGGGVALLLESIARAERFQPRLLARVDGERRLTDLRHIAELLHRAAHDEALGTTALASWLRRRMAEAMRDSDDERSRRLESDAEAVQVLTIHRSKGLEFPVVLLPFLWDMGRARDPEPHCFHDPDAGDLRLLDVTMEEPLFSRHLALARDEQRGEDLRLAYVALTRARHQAVVWWAGAYASKDSPLSRMVLARNEDGTIRPAGPRVPDDDFARAAFEAVAARADGCVTVERAIPGPPAEWGEALGSESELQLATFTRPIDHRWRRTSYSALTAVAHENFGDTDPLVGSEPEEPPQEDEGAEIPSGSSGAASLGLAAMPVGAAVGTLVHQVLQEADFAAEDLAGELGRALELASVRRTVDLGEREAVLSGLQSALETPLGSHLGDLRLREVARGDRLDELEFELPLAGGEEPSAAVSPALIAEVLEAHLPPGDPLSAYPGLLRAENMRQGVRGYLTGFLDLVVRVHHVSGPRFLIVDYKTNWLAPPGEELDPHHYRQAALAEEMERRHYVLQALLYLVALHRYLRWRLAHYDPEAQLAGVVYAFLRGMSGPATPREDGQPNGVFAWRAPRGLVAALSDALDRGGSLAERPS